MYSLLSWLVLIISCEASFAQDTDTLLKKSNAYKPEVLTSGFIDILNNGQINASARFIRLYIGEPGRFSIPLSFYSGVSANNFNNAHTPHGKTNEHLANNFITPLSGLVNVSIDRLTFFQNTKQITKTGFLYHIGEKVLTGFKQGDVSDPQTGSPITFLNSFAAAGGYFQTGAWERNNTKNLGIFWFTLRYIGTYTNPRNLQSLMPEIQTSGLYHGYSIGSGVEINDLLNLKILYYRYIKKPEMNFSESIYQLSFNYSIEK